VTHRTTPQGRYQLLAGPRNRAIAGEPAAVPVRYLAEVTG
jgi:hypothetical protein